MPSLAVQVSYRSLSHPARPVDLSATHSSAQWAHSLIDGLLMLSVIYLVAGVARNRQPTKLPYIHITMYIYIYSPHRWCVSFGCLLKLGN